MYDTILARSFSRHDQKKLGYGALLGFLIIVLSFCSLFKHLGPLPVLKLSLSSASDLKMLVVSEMNPSRKIVKDPQFQEPTTESLSCNLMEPRSDFCEITGDIRVQGSSATVFLATSSPPHRPRTLRPYARKGDAAAMSAVRRWSVNPTPQPPKCTVNHSVPAVLFSSGGYANNHFHAFSDILIPLYLTSADLRRHVIFLATDSFPPWTARFQEILKGLSRFDVIDVDDKEHVHCFKKITVGLKHHKELSIDQTRSHHNMSEFRQFLRQAYSLKSPNVKKNANNNNNYDNYYYKPRLLIISRNRSRSFTNAAAISNLAREVGFEVVVSEAGAKLASFAPVVNSCDALMGVHGAGMTNMAFLPEGAVVVQVVPLGNLRWLAATDYGEPARGMGLRYLEYEIEERESTLAEEYDQNDVVLRDPSVLERRGWEAFRAVYMEKQNVRLDVERFRPTLVKALEILKNQV